MQGTDEFLKQRVKELPEERVANTHYNEEGMNRRLAEYKKNNDSTTGESILADFFKERFIEPLVINVTNPSNDSFDNLRTFIERNGTFSNYMTHEETKELKRENELNEELEQQKKKE